MGWPLANSAAIADAKVHPVPCVFRVSTRDEGSSCHSTPAKITKFNFYDFVTLSAV